MTRRLRERRLVVASHNPGKAREIAELLAPYEIETISAAKLNLPEPEETETTFIGNARLKALAAAQRSGLPALADDSGLCVDALGGDPGLYSARWAGPLKDFSIAMKKVHEKLEASGDANRHGRFVSALALAWPDGHSEVFEGEVGGELIWPPRGDKGFGYDPMFVPEGYTQTFGEMDQATKHAMSHRARAFKKFVEACLA